MKRTRDFGEVILAKLANNPALAEQVETHAFSAKLAMKVYDIRTQARLNQKQLADLVGTQQSVISRIEDADYDGHSLSLLRKIAAALGKNLDVVFTDPVTTARPAEITTFTPQWGDGDLWEFCFTSSETSKPICSEGEWFGKTGFQLPSMKSIDGSLVPSLK